MRLRPALAILLLAAGCFDLGDTFICSGDKDCGSNASGNGVCVPTTKLCAFPDLTCSGMQQLRYGPHAGYDSNLCVDEAADLADGALTSDAGDAGDAGDAAQNVGDLGGACSRPQLMIPVEDVSATVTMPGQVLRFSIAGDGSLSPCGTLSGSGNLDSLPQSAAFFPPNYIAVAGRDSIAVIDADTDLIQWNVPVPGNGSPPLTMEVVPVINTTDGNRTWVVVGYSSDYSGNIDLIYGYRDGTTQPKVWDTNTNLNLATELGDITGRTPINDTFVGLNDGYESAIDADPFTNMHTNYLGPAGGTDPLRTLYEIDVGSTRRLVWVGDMTNGIYFINDDGMGETIVGPATCTANPSCTLRHAVPDPSASDAYFLLCDVSGGQANDRTVWRYVVGGSCTKVFDGTMFDSDHRLAKLAIAMP